MKLSDKDFLKVIDATPLVSIDFVVIDRKDCILMGKRTNQPALGSWFVPGGRIKKGEDVGSAISRIAKAELSLNLTKDDGRFIGVFDHSYDTNFAKVEGIHTQYVVLAYEFYLNLDCKKLPREQHSEWEWVCKSEAGKVHENSAAYFRAVKEIDDAGYSALNARRDSFNNLLWQTPVLSLVAQAFLFTVILSASTEPVSRQIAALLALFTAVASLQLLAKHRWEEKNLAVELDSIEKATGRFRVNRYRRSGNWFIKRSSYLIWLVVLSLFVIMALIALLFPCLITT